jgi:hypothetical protein
MSKWDWLHAGLEIATYIEAQNAKQSLAEMKTTAQLESARRMLIEAMKNFVFDVSRDIQLAEEQIEYYPQQVYVVSELLNHRLTKSGLSSEIFPDFQDKEYVLKTQKKISQVIAQSKSKLAEEEVQNSDLAVKYIKELPFLKQAISVQSTKESLSKLDKSLTDLKAELSKERTEKISKKAPVLVLILVLSCLAMTLEIDALLGFGIIGIVVASVLGLGMLNNDSPLNKKVEGLNTDRKKIIEKQDIPEKDWQTITSKFRNANSTKLKEIYEERISFLAPILGEEFQKYLSN